MHVVEYIQEQGEAIFSIMLRPEFLFMIVKLQPIGLYQSCLMKNWRIVLFLPQFGIRNYKKRV